MSGWEFVFRWIVFFGIAVNLSLAVPALLLPNPNSVLELVGGAPVVYTMWPRFAALLLILLSMFYIFPALDVLSRQHEAYLAIASRAAGACFFLLFFPEYLIFGLIDLTFGVLQAAAMVMAVRKPVMPSLPGED